MDMKDKFWQAFDSFLDTLRLVDDDDDDGGLEEKIQVIEFVPVEKSTFPTRVIERILGLQRIEVHNRK